MRTRDSEPGLEEDTSSGGDSGALGTLFEVSPAQESRTSAPAEIGFLMGLVAIAVVPFTLTAGLAVGAAALAVVFGIVGLARASQPGLSGGILAAAGLVLGLAAIALVGLRYAGIDTTVGDAWLPTMRDGLSALTGLLPPVT